MCGGCQGLHFWGETTPAQTEQMDVDQARDNWTTPPDHYVKAAAPAPPKGRGKGQQMPKAPDGATSAQRPAAFPALLLFMFLVLSTILLK